MDGWEAGEEGALTFVHNISGITSGSNFLFNGELFSTINLLNELSKKNNTRLLLYDDSHLRDDSFLGLLHSQVQKLVENTEVRIVHSRKELTDSASGSSVLHFESPALALKQVQGKTLLENAKQQDPSVQTVVALTHSFSAFKPENLNQTIEAVNKKKLDKVICLSNSSMQSFVTGCAGFKEIAKKGRCAVIPRFVDRARYKPIKGRERRELDELYSSAFGSPDIILVFQGKINKNKGAHHIAPLLKNVSGNGVKPALVFSGSCSSSEYGKKIISEVSSACSENNIPLLFAKDLSKFVPPSEMSVSILSSEPPVKRNSSEFLSLVCAGTPLASLFPFFWKPSVPTVSVLPHTWNEAFGRTALESLSSGVPAIVGNTGGPSETVEQDFSGKLVDTRKPNGAVPKSLAGALAEILGDYNSFSKNALSSASRIQPAEVAEDYLRQVSA